MSYREQLGAFARQTAATPSSVPRLLSKRGRSPRRWPVLVVALAAVTLLTLGLWWRRPTPVSGDMAEAGERDLGDAVHVRWDGAGVVRGDSRHLAVAWQAGELSVEVTPGQGVDLVVQTDEAEVRVVGTGFSVRRDAFGTRVTVRHGAVRVGCQDGSASVLGAGDSSECLPGSAAALLGRARAQERRGDPVDRILDTLNLALPLASGPVAIELRLLRATRFARSGRLSEARADVDAALSIDDGGVRRAELLQLAQTWAPVETP